jgi:hypothetical protein
MHAQCFVDELDSCPALIGMPRDIFSEALEYGCRE